MEDGRLEFQVYFQSDFVPFYSTMQVYAESKDGVHLDAEFVKKLEFNDHFKMITIQVDLKKDTYVFFSIKFDKKLKTFEDYPNDPDRGHDIVIIYHHRDRFRFPLNSLPQVEIITPNYISRRIKSLGFLLLISLCLSIS